MKLPFAPHHRFRAALGPEEHKALLEWTLEHEERLVPAKLTGGVVDETRRRSRTTRELGRMGPLLRSWLTPKIPEMLRAIGVAPFEVEFIELELAAHGDGAHFARHTDIPVGPGRRPLGGDGTGTQDRIVSAVYYFHREPKAFSGGELRLHRLGSTGAEGDYLDIPPEQNSLVVFPSWAPHEVLEIRSPGGRFEDSRFAVNCWLCRTLR